MAREVAHAFFQKLHEDRLLRERLAGIGQKDVGALLRFAADAGYLFSRRDYQAALEANGELPESTRRRLASGKFVIPGLRFDEDAGD